jgi:hypothetical protein
MVLDRVTHDAGTATVGRRIAKAGPRNLTRYAGGP